MNVPSGNYSSVSMVLMPQNTNFMTQHRRHITSNYNKGLNEDLRNTVLDPSLGPIEPTDACIVCSLPYIDCKGHTGYIDLGDNMIANPFLIDHIKLLLSIVCVDPNCSAYAELPFGNLYQELKYIRQEESSRSKLQVARNIMHGAVCHGILSDGVQKCGRKLGNIVKGNSDNTEFEIKSNKVTISIRIIEVYKLFYSMCSKKMNIVMLEQLAMSGTNIPVNFIMRYIIVPPNNVRPPNRHTRGKHEVTTRLNGIITKLTNVHIIDNTSSAITMEVNKLLSTKVSNTDIVTGVIATIGKIIESLVNPRSIDSSGRNVLAPYNPAVNRSGTIMLSINQARNLTRELTVNASNKDDIRRLARYNMITMYKKANDKRFRSFDNISLSINYKPKVGDKVRVGLVDGNIIDIVRFPVLYSGGYNLYQVLVAGHQPVCYYPEQCAPIIGGDYDGDEANERVHNDPLSLGSAEYLKMRSHSLYSDNPKITASLMQNHLVSLYYLTHDDTIIDNDVALQIYDEYVRYNNPPTSYFTRLKYNSNIKSNDTNFRFFIMNKANTIRGRYMFSLTLPNGFNYRDGSIVIINGILVSGIVRGKHVSSNHDALAAIISVTSRQINSKAIDPGVDFIDKLTHLLHLYQTYVRSISVGIDDYIPKSPINNGVFKFIKKQYTDYSVNAFRDLYNNTGDESLFFQVSAIPEISKIKKLLNDSPIVDNIDIGLIKGPNLTNTAFSISMPEIESYGRVGSAKPVLDFDNIPSYIDDQSIIGQNYADGLSVPFSLYAAISARNQIIEKFVNASNRGWLTLRMQRFSVGHIIRYDGAVIDPNGNLISPLYGMDNLATDKILHRKIDGKYHNIPFDIETEIMTAIHTVNYNKAITAPSLDSHSFVIQYNDGDDVPINVQLDDICVSIELDRKYGHRIIWLNIQEDAYEDVIYGINERLINIIIKLVTTKLPNDIVLPDNIDVILVDNPIDHIDNSKDDNDYIVTQQ